MKLICFSIRDAKTMAWGPPVTARTPGEALRSFSDEVNGDKSRSMIALHPEDFEMFQIGSFDTDTGDMTPEHAVSLAKGVNLVVER